MTPENASFELFYDGAWLPITNWGTDEHDVEEERLEDDPLDIIVCVVFDDRQPTNKWGVFNYHDAPNAMLSIRRCHP
jgi:hypothetical protein